MKQNKSPYIVHKLLDGTEYRELVNFSKLTHTQAQVSRPGRPPNKAVIDTKLVAFRLPLPLLKSLKAEAKLRKTNLTAIVLEILLANQPQISDK